MAPKDEGPSRVLLTSLSAIGIALGVVVALFTSDVILGVIAGSAFIAIAVGLVRLWTGGGSPRPHHP